MKKCEYLCLDISFNHDLIRMTPKFDLSRTVSLKTSELIVSLDRLGEQQWELINVLGSSEYEIYYFKRFVD